MVGCGLVMTITLYDFVISFVSQYSDIRMMNLSLLTSNFFWLEISILIFGQHASWMYLIKFFCLQILIATFTLLRPKENSIEGGLLQSLQADLSLQSNRSDTANHQPFVGSEIEYDRVHKSRSYN
jgi:hypothetical protein